MCLCMKKIIFIQNNSIEFGHDRFDGCVQRVSVREDGAIPGGRSCVSVSCPCVYSGPTS